MSNRKVIELLLQLKNAKTRGRNYIKVKPHLVRHLLRNCLLYRVIVALSDKALLKPAFVIPRSSVETTTKSLSMRRGPHYAICLTDYLR